MPQYVKTTWVNGKSPFINATNLNKIEDGIFASVTQDGSTSMSGQFVTIAGTAGTPSIAPTGDSDTGIFFPATNTIAFAEGGAEAMRIDSSGNVGIGVIPSGWDSAWKAIQLGNSTSLVGTTATAMALSNNAFFDGTNNKYITTNFATRYLQANGIHSWYTAPSGTANNNISFSELMRIDSSGNVGIGTSSPATRFHVDGTIRYTNRPAAGTITAMGWDTNGDLRASSSSLRYKHDIEDYNKGLNEVMQLRPVSFKFNGEERTNIGFIAEEVDELGLNEVMLYNEEQQPEGVMYANMIAILTKAMQEQQVIIESLKARIEVLEGQN